MPYRERVRDMSSMVMIHCPETGRDVAMGILTDSASFKRLRDERAWVSCPACRQTHKWLVLRPWLMDYAVAATTDPTPAAKSVSKRPAGSLRR